MEKIRNIWSKIDIDKTIKYGTYGTAGLTLLYLLYYFFTHCFSLSQSFRYNLYFLNILVLMIIPTVYLAYKLIKKADFKYTRLYLVVAICWGLAMQFAMPPISGADEPQHVISAFHASNLMMGIEDGNRDGESAWVQGESYFYMRACDIEGFNEVNLSFPKQFEYIANGEWFHTENTELEEYTVAPSEWYRYIFSGFGITIGRLLHFGFYGTVFLGRLMNTLIYVAIGWFCVKILPVGKIQTIIFALLPMTLNLCNSYSYDNMSIMLTLLLLSLHMYYSKPDTKVHFWDLYILIATVILLMPNKIVYVFFMFWFFCIPFKKWKDLILSKKWYEYAGLASFLYIANYARNTVFWKFFFIARRYVVWKTEGEGIEQDPTRPSYTWSYIQNNVWSTVKFCLEGIKEDFWYNIKHCIGSELGLISLGAPVNVRWTILLLILIIASFIIAGKGKKMKKQQLIVGTVVVVVVLVAIFIGCLVRFTPTEDTTHVQISYRYLIPCYMALMVLFGNDAKENRNALGIVYAENLTLVFTMTSILTYLFTR